MGDDDKKKEKKEKKEKNSPKNDDDDGDKKKKKEKNKDGDKDDDNDDKKDESKKDKKKDTDEEGKTDDDVDKKKKKSKKKDKKNDKDDDDINEKADDKDDEDDDDKKKSTKKKDKKNDKDDEDDFDKKKSKKKDKKNDKDDEDEDNDEDDDDNADHDDNKKSGKNLDKKPSSSSQGKQSMSNKSMSQQSQQNQANPSMGPQQQVQMQSVQMNQSKLGGIPENSAIVVGSVGPQVQETQQFYPNQAAQPIMVQAPAKRPSEFNTWDNDIQGEYLYNPETRQYEFYQGELPDAVKAQSRAWEAAMRNNQAVQGMGVEGASMNPALQEAQNASMMNRAHGKSMQQSVGGAPHMSMGGAPNMSSTGEPIAGLMNQSMKKTSVSGNPERSNAGVQFPSINGVQQASSPSAPSVMVMGNNGEYLPIWNPNSALLAQLQEETATSGFSDMNGNPISPPGTNRSSGSGSPRHKKYVYPGETPIDVLPPTGGRILAYGAHTGAVGERKFSPKEGQVNLKQYASASPSKYVANPAFLDLPQFLDSQLKLCRTWMSLHDQSMNTGEHELINSIMGGLSQPLVQLHFETADPADGRVFPASPRSGSPRFGEDGSRLHKKGPFPETDVLLRAKTLVRKPIRRIDSKVNAQVRRALQEAFVYFARADTRYTMSSIKKPVWVSIYQWQLFLQSFHVSEITGFDLETLMGKFGPRREPIDFVYFLDMLSDLAVAYIEKENFPLMMADLNKTRENSDKIAALYRLAEIFQMDEKCNHRKFLRGRGQIRVANPNSRVAYQPESYRVASQNRTMSQLMAAQKDSDNMSVNSNEWAGQFQPKTIVVSPSVPAGKTSSPGQGGRSPKTAKSMGVKNQPAGYTASNRAYNQSTVINASMPTFSSMQQMNSATIALQEGTAKQQQASINQLSNAISGSAPVGGVTNRPTNAVNQNKSMPASIAGSASQRGSAKNSSSGSQKGGSVNASKSGTPNKSVGHQQWDTSWDQNAETQEQWTQNADGTWTQNWTDAEAAAWDANAGDVGGDTSWDQSGGADNSWEQSGGDQNWDGWNQQKANSTIAAGEWDNNASSWNKTGDHTWNDAQGWDYNDPTWDKSWDQGAQQW